VVVTLELARGLDDPLALRLTLLLSPLQLWSALILLASARRLILRLCGPLAPRSVLLLSRLRLAFLLTRCRGLLPRSLPGLGHGLLDLLPHALHNLALQVPEYWLDGL
jgi:hypothetical protein